MSIEELTTFFLEGLTTGSIYALVALGLGLIFGVMNVVNLAHAEVTIVALYLTIVVYEAGVESLVLAASIGFLGATAFGVAMYFGAMRYVMKSENHFRQIVFTFAIVLFLQNGYLLVFGPEPKLNQLGMSQTVDLLGVPFLVSRLLAGVVGVVLVLLISVLVFRTNFGRSMRAVAADPFGAEVTGVSASRTGAKTFALSVALAAAAGVLIAPFTTATSTLGLELTIRAFLVVIIAGAGSPVGILLTGLGLGIVESFGVTFMPSAIATTLVYVAIIPILLFRPRGLFTRATA